MIGILQSRLKEANVSAKNLFEIKPGIKLRREFLKLASRVNHSIADAVALAIDTPHGMVVHTGDFKFDQTQ